MQSLELQRIPEDEFQSLVLLLKALGGVCLESAIRNTQSQEFAKGEKEVLRSFHISKEVVNGRRMVKYDRLVV